MHFPYGDSEKIKVLKCQQGSSRYVGFTFRLWFLCPFVGTLTAQSPYSSDLVTGDTHIVRRQL